MPGFNIQVDKDVEYDVHDKNVLYDVVAWSRARQVLNEEQSCATLLIALTGLLPDHKDYAAGYISGGSSGGKTHMRDEVILPLFALKKEWIYTTTSSSAKALIDDEDLDHAKIAMLNEMNKIPPEMMEFLKSIFGDDGGHEYSRNKPDPDSDSGFKAVKVSSDPKPFIFMLADENKMEIEAELETRMIEIKVDETEDKNMAVHDMHWGHRHLKLKDAPFEYVYDAPELRYALQQHVANIPVDTPVVLPTGEGRFDGDDWDAAAITKPMFLFSRSQSTRASRMVSSLVKASALFNYHARPTTMMEKDGEMVEHIIATREDVANIIAIRKTLMNVTHGLDEKKLAIIDAILETGGVADASGSALQATRKQIEKHVNQNKNISTIGKNEVKKLLEEMNDMYLLDIQQNPADNREYIYVYNGTETLDRPAIDAGFKTVFDPILDQPVSETIRGQQERLGAKNPSDIIMNEPEASDSPAETTDVDAKVLEHLRSFDGTTVNLSDLSGIEVEHMLGIVPVGETATQEDIDGTIMDPDNDVWPNGLSVGDVRSRINNSLSTLRSAGKWTMTEDGDTVTVTVK